ncbi:hypothetical protein CERZMDRAFT_97867 [Cercospora zeae-maydis SCOH1-5]|uniref:Uncharacterized protein n=1 Tax=Cercospora zeae-maydis SCOH1-5 TaxID=717836 RepID=A0A6A6FES7_9PEZI|nr:hypothetical protein CERZMDRAFT_97867 [Cercospora zeae-maydis SCOH1-5]
MAPHIAVKSAVFLATNLLFLQSTVLAQEAQAIANPALQQDAVNDTNNNGNNNPIQLTDPSDLTSYISPNSPTPIPTTPSSSTASGQLVICTTLPSDGNDEAAYGASSECRTYLAVTSFMSLTGTAATEGILTASETRPGFISQSTSESTTTATGTSTGTSTGTAKPTETKTGESGGVVAARMAGLGLWTIVLAVGGVMGL